MTGRESPPPRVLLAVTDPVSLRLLSGLPVALSERGWQVDVVVGGESPSLPGATTWLVPMQRDAAPLADLVALVRWIRLVRRRHPSAVLVGTPKAGLLGLLAAWITRVPVRVYHLRGLRLESAHGIQARVLTILERVAMRAATAVVAVSDSLRDECLNRRLTDPSKIVVLGRGSSNGVDLGRFAECFPISRADRTAKWGLDPSLDVVGFVGRVTPSKGLTTMVDAAQVASSQGARFQVLLVGPEEVPGYGRQLIRALESAGVPAAHVPWVDDVATVYPAMDVLCLPSLREGFPNVVLEASAASLAVVTTDATGCRDAVMPDVTGWISKAGDVDDLARALGVALSDGERRRQVGAAGRRFVEESFARAHVQGLVANFLSDATRREACATNSRELSA